VLLKGLKILVLKILSLLGLAPREVRKEVAEKAIISIMRKGRARQNCLRIDNAASKAGETSGKDASVTRVTVAVVFAVLLCMLVSFPSSAEDGLVVPPPPPDWVKLEKHATEGYPAAQVELGKFYLQTQKNYKDAEFWFRKAAEQGYPAGQFYLGQFYQAGLGVEKNPAEAAKWYLLAAEQGNFDAEWALSGMYASGTGVEKDIVLSYAWCSLAWSQDARPCAETKAQMTAMQIKEASKAIEKTRDRQQQLQRSWPLEGNPKVKPAGDPY